MNLNFNTCIISQRDCHFHVSTVIILSRNFFMFPLITGVYKIFIQDKS